jgi:acyl-CoA thioester hydrolase
MNAFTWPVRVYYEDVDVGGIVYYANYMKFLERARTEWLRSLGIEQMPLKEEHGVIFVVVDLQAHYLKPARYGELLQVTCRVAEQTRASLTFEQQIHRDAELLLEGTVRVACLDAQKYRPRPLPQALAQEMSRRD